jgi:hypothetical protein
MRWGHPSEAISGDPATQSTCSAAAMTASMTTSKVTGAAVAATVEAGTAAPRADSCRLDRGSRSCARRHTPAAEAAPAVMAALARRGSAVTTCRNFCRACVCETADRRRAVGIIPPHGHIAQPLPPPPWPLLAFWVQGGASSRSRMCHSLGAHVRRKTLQSALQVLQVRRATRPKEALDHTIAHGETERITTAPSREHNKNRSVTEVESGAALPTLKACESAERTAVSQSVVKNKISRQPP